MLTGLSFTARLKQVGEILDSATAFSHVHIVSWKCDCSPENHGAFATEKRFMLFTLYFVFNFNSESFNITGNA